MRSRSAAPGIGMTEVERISMPSDETVLERYIATSTPVILTGGMRQWPAVEGWTLDALDERFGDRVITVGHLRDGHLVVDDDEGVSQEEMTLSRYIESLRSGRTDNGYYLITPVDERLPELLDDIVPPALVARARWRSVRLWLGAAGVTSPLHRDFPENIYAQVSGKKRITLIAPRHRSRVYSRKIFSGAPNFSRVDLDVPDYERFPRFRDVPHLSCELEAGELLYIPRLWWHHVRALEAGASLNLWFANGWVAMAARLLQTYASLRGLRR